MIRTYLHITIDFSDAAVKEYDTRKLISFVKLKHSKDYGLAAKIQLEEPQINGLLILMLKYIAALKKLIGMDTASLSA